MDNISSSLTPGSFGFAFGLTLLAGLATGLGAAVAFFAARANQRVLALSLAFSAGVMLYVSFVESFQRPPLRYRRTTARRQPDGSPTSGSSAGSRRWR